MWGELLNKLGEYLKKARLRQGLSLKEVQNKTGLTDSRLSRIENGSTAFELGPSYIKALAKLYKIDLVEFLINTGYLDNEALSAYKRVFQNVDLLNNDEKKHIQEQIDLFTKGRTNT